MSKGASGISGIQGEIFIYQDGAIMAHIWTATIVINAALATQLIREQTNLDVHTISVLGEGFDNVAYLVNSQYVFRFPRRPMGVICMQNEILVLPYLAKFVSFRFTCPEFIGKPTELFNYPFAGYASIPGKPLCNALKPLVSDRRFAIELAGWLRELHAIPILDSHYTSIVGEHDWRLNVSDRAEKCSKQVEQYEDHYLAAGFDREQLLDCIQKMSGLQINPDYKKAYVHGDLYSRHIMVDHAGKLTGLIDWGDVHIGHPALDLAVGVMIFDSGTLEAFWQAYGSIDAEIKKITYFRAFYHAMLVLPYSYEMKDQRLKEWTIAALRNAVIYWKNVDRN